MMARRADAPKLLDVMARHQIYLEGYKEHVTQDFSNVTRQLRRDIREVFLDIPYAEMRQMTKRELADFIRQLRIAQNRSYNLWTARLLEDLRKFMAVDAKVHVELVEGIEEDDTPKSNRAFLALLALLGLSKMDRLWTKIANTPVPAHGVTMTDYLDRFREQGDFALVSAVQRAWVNKETVAATLASVVGTERLLLRDGVLLRAIPQADALATTLVQHVSAMVSEAVLSEFYETYTWVSILDSVTSDVCRERAGKVFVYGEGPMPPAHPRCRSHAVPNDGEPMDATETFRSWRSRQPAAVQDDAPIDDKGKLVVKPLTLGMFTAKVSTMLDSGSANVG